jgi:hypothetical protein
MQNGYMLESYENINQGHNGYNGHVNAEPQGPGQGQGQGRVYQYDERYHNEGNEHSHQNTRHQDGSELQPGDNRRRAQSKREY